MAGLPLWRSELVAHAQVSSGAVGGAGGTGGSSRDFRRSWATLGHPRSISAVVSVLPPAGVVGVDHRTAPDAVQYARQFGLGLSSHSAGGIHDGPKLRCSPCTVSRYHWMLGPVDIQIFRG